MKTAFSIMFLAIGIAFTSVTSAQDVQGMSSGTTGKPQNVQVNTGSETLKGEVAMVYEASGQIGIKLSGTVGSSNMTAPTYFKVRDGLLFNAVKPGDKVSVEVERKGEEMTITKLTKE
jgi:Cu/Ag efflux protein CusF